MSRRAVDAIFQALFNLSDLRALMRETAPDHVMDDEQRQRAQAYIEKAKRQITIIEEELIR